MLKTNHPCFNPTASVNHSRIHLPVAGSCNIQCKFCNRDYDCANESRPGVTSTLLSPEQALHYLGKATEITGPVSVVGIAGPGDPFSDADATMKTLRLVRDKDPSIMLCVASNGLNIGDYIEELSTLNVAHISITVNFIDPEIGAQIISWVRFGKKIYRGVEGAKILVDRQLEAIRKMHELGITVKINCVVIPNVNSYHVEEISRVVAGLGADVFNAMPLIAVAGSELENSPEPDHELMQTVRWKASSHIEIVRHCKRCRADAAGLLGAETNNSITNLLQQIGSGPLNPLENRPYVAVATRDGYLINEHLGKALNFYVYGPGSEKDKFELVAIRPAPPAGDGTDRWKALADQLKDCRKILVSQSGVLPSLTLESEGIQVVNVEGLIDESLIRVYANQELIPVIDKKPCGGNGNGCG